jgi:hypothetical protein
MKLKQLLYLLPFYFAATVFADPIVIKNVNFLSMENDQIQQNQTVIITDGQISWVGHTDNAVIPEGAQIIEGNYYVMPGLSEMHAHLPAAAEGIESIQTVLTLNLTQGLTTIRGMLGDPLHLELREQAANGEIISPRIITTGPSFSGQTAIDPEYAREMVREQSETGYDLLKMHPGLNLDVFNAIADEASQVGIEFSGHISLDVGLEHTLESGQGTIDHLDRYMEFLAGEAANRVDPPVIYFGYDLTPYVDESKIETAAQITVQAGAWNVPTNTLLDNIFNPNHTPEEMAEWPGMEYVPPALLTNWVTGIGMFRESENYDPEMAEKFLGIRNKLTYALYEHGAHLLLGADAPQIFNPPGYSTHRELELLVKAGLSPFEALKTGTVNLGKYLGEEESTGIIAPGFRADILILNVNPLENIPFNDHIEGVISQGDYISKDKINSLLEQVLQRIHE